MDRDGLRPNCAIYDTPVAEELRTVLTIKGCEGINRASSARGDTISSKEGDTGRNIPVPLILRLPSDKLKTQATPKNSSYQGACGF